MGPCCLLMSSGNFFSVWRVGLKGGECYSVGAIGGQPVAGRFRQPASVGCAAKHRSERLSRSDEMAVGCCSSSASCVQIFFTGNGGERTRGSIDPQIWLVLGWIFKCSDSFSFCFNTGQWFQSVKYLNVRYSADFWTFQFWWWVDMFWWLHFAQVFCIFSANAAISHQYLLFAVIVWVAGVAHEYTIHDECDC